MVKEFTCHNFQNIDANELGLSQVNILIGSNNSGMSNFIRALTFSISRICDVMKNGILQMSLDCWSVTFG